MPQTISLSQDYDKALSVAKRIILAGGTFVYPTDTLYGIGCDATSKTAVEKIYTIKSRDASKPLSILVSDYSMLLELCEVSPTQERMLHALLPGPYTFILKLRKPLPASSRPAERLSVASGAPSATSQTMEIGVRVPEHYFARQISRELGLPIVTTSANLSGEKGAALMKDVDAAVSSKADLLIDGGACQYAQSSTVIDLLRMKVLRKGAVREGDTFVFAPLDKSSPPAGASGDRFEFR